MKTHEVIRLIDGIYYRCIDTACNDFDRAEYNRYLVANKLFITGYLEVELALQRTPLTSPLPKWIRPGEVPQVGGEGKKRFEAFHLEVVEDLTEV